MNTKLLKAVVIGSIVHVTATTAAGDTPWSRIAPQGAGFSVEAPGELQPSDSPGQYTFNSTMWFLTVKSVPVDASTRRQVERRDRKALLRCLEMLRDSMIGAMDGATRRSSSSGDIDGYPSLRFSMENQELQGTSLLVVTADRLFIVVTAGPKGSAEDVGKRFVRSFRLVQTDPAAASHDVNAASSNPAAKLTMPMLAVARLIVDEKLSPRIDEVVQHAPPAARLGNRWGPSNSAYQQARGSFSRRIERVVRTYENSGDMARTLDTELQRLSPESQAAFSAALNGPAGAAIVRQLALGQFISLMMADDPAGPRPGGPGWHEKVRALETVFDGRIGAAVPRHDTAHRADVGKFFSAGSTDVLDVCFAAVSKAMGELEGAINVTLFDEREIIQREIETVIARAM